MVIVRAVLIALLFTALPGCQGCQNRKIIADPEASPAPDPKGPPPPLTPGPPGTSDPGDVTDSDGDWSGAARTFSRVAVQGGDSPYFRLEFECDGDASKISLDGTYGCLSSKPLSVRVIRGFERWSVYRVIERRGASTREYFVSDPPGPGEGRPGFKSDVEVPEDQRDSEPPTGNHESSMSLSGFGVAFQWAVFPASGQGTAPSWATKPIKKAELRWIRSDRPSEAPAIDLCRSELEELLASRAKSFVIGARVMQETQVPWPSPGPESTLSAELWSEPISREQIEAQLRILKDGRLPKDPGVGAPPPPRRPKPGDRADASARARPDAGSAPPTGSVSAERTSGTTFTASASGGRRGSARRSTASERPSSRSDPAATAGCPFTPELASSSPDNKLLSDVRYSLALPENAGFCSWVQLDHALRLPAARMAGFDWAWTDPAGSDAAARVSIDVGAGEAIESHFGVPAVAFPSVFAGGPLVERALDDLACPLALQHGISATSDRIEPDHQWIVDRSSPLLAGAANAILSVSKSRADGEAGLRRRVEALAAFVQSGIPYVRVDGGGPPESREVTYRFGLRTPIATMLDGGDCDSKSVLLASLIRSIEPELPLALVYCMSDDTPHMMLAVGCAPHPGDAVIRFEGVDGVLVETTTAMPLGAEVGGISKMEPRVLSSTPRA
jgi:hypothetical protein